MGVRIKEYDIAKGIGMMLVVLGHIEIENMSQVSSFIYQFHIPLFFFLSGLFFKSGKQLVTSIFKRFERIYVPAVVANTAFLCVFIIMEIITGHQVIVLDMIKHLIKLILGIAVTPLGGATWFLYVLFRVFVIYSFIDFFLSKIKEPLAKYLKWITIFAIALIGFLTNLPFQLERECIALLFFFMGNEIYISGVATRLNSRFFWVKAIVSLVSFCIVAFISKYNTPDICRSEYGPPYLMITSSLLGIVLTLSISSIIATELNNIQSLLIYIGKYSLWILIGHFCAFRIITILQVILYNYPIENILCHPTFITSGIWPIIYFISGLALPLSAAYLLNSYRAK